MYLKGTAEVTSHSPEIPYLHFDRFSHSLEILYLYFDRFFFHSLGEWVNIKILERKLHIIFIFFCKNASPYSCFVLSLKQKCKPGIPMAKLAVELLGEESFLSFCFSILSVIGKPKCHTKLKFYVVFLFSYKWGTRIVDLLHGK